MAVINLHGKLDYVRNVVTDYFNHLIDLGVAGIRNDAPKHVASRKHHVYNIFADLHLENVEGYS